MILDDDPLRKQRIHSKRVCSSMYRSCTTIAVKTSTLVCSWSYVVWCMQYTWIESLHFQAANNALPFRSNQTSSSLPANGAYFRRRFVQEGTSLTRPLRLLWRWRFRFCHFLLFSRGEFTHVYECASLLDVSACVFRFLELRRSVCVRYNEVYVCVCMYVSDSERENVCCV